MASGMKVPPPPLTTQDKSVWASWYIAIKDAINKLTTSLKWTLLDFTGSNITDIAAKSHQNLDNLQGGSSTERYHLTSAQLTGLTGGGNTTLHKHRLTATATLDFPSIAADGIAELTVTVTGATAGNPVMLGPPAAIEAGLTWSGFVSAADTVTIRLHNTSSAAVDPASASWTVSVHA